MQLNDEMPAVRSNSNRGERAIASDSGVFEGPVLRRLLALSAPICVGMCVQVGFYVANTFWIALIDRSSAVYVGAMGMIMPIAQILLAICNGITVATSSILSRALGSGDERAIKSVVTSSLWVALTIASAFLVLGYWFDSSIVRALGARGEYFVPTRTYLRYLLPSVVILCSTSVLAGILQGHGAMRSVMNGLLIGVATNTILDPLFIRVFGLGLRGAALATLLSQLAILVSYLVTVFRGRLGDPRFLRFALVARSEIWAVVALAGPVSFSQATAAFGYLVYNRIIADIDVLAVTSFSLCARFDQLVLIPVSAVALAVGTLVGKNAGRGNFARVRKIWRGALMFAWIAVAVLATTMILAAPRLYGFAQHHPVVVEYAVRQTRTMEYGFLLTATCMLSNAVFQGIGRSLPIAVITLAQLFLVALPLMALLRAFHAPSLLQVWLCLIAGNLVAAIASVIWVRKEIGRRERAAQ